MFSRIIAISVKELKLLLRDGAALGVLFLLPIVFVSIMTYAGVGRQGVQTVSILVVNEDQGPAAGWIIERLKKDRDVKIVDHVNGVAVDAAQATSTVKDPRQSHAMAMMFPKDFSERLLKGEGKGNEGVVRLVVDPAVGDESIVPYERLIRTRVMEVAAAIQMMRDSEHVLKQLAGKSAADPAVKSLMQQYVSRAGDLPGEVKPNVRMVREHPDGVERSRPMTSAEQNVPGYTIFGIFFIVQVIGNTILREKESGTIIRLLVAPVSKFEILIGKLIPFYLVNLIQVAVLFAFGALVFDMDLRDSVPGLLVVTLGTAAAANALGLLIAAVSRSTEQMGPMSGLILVVMAALGGVLIPLFEMPRLMQAISLFTPHAWALKGYQDVMVRGYGVAELGPTVGALFGFAVVFYLLALWRFRFD